MTIKLVRSADLLLLDQVQVDLTVFSEYTETIDRALGSIGSIARDFLEGEVDNALYLVSCSYADTMLHCIPGPHSLCRLGQMQ